MTQALQLILSLSILIVLHELGHFIPAKLFKTRVEKFYLFFDPWFSLFKIKRGDTEYGIGWLPLGGYVKISGMIDESMDKEQMKLPPQPWEFRAKPAWQRLIIMLGGVTVNVILGVFIYAMVLFAWGEQYLPVENAKYGIACDSLALKAGLKDGDKVISIDNKKVDSFNSIPLEILINKASSIQVEREGEKLNIPIAEEILSDMLKHKTSFVTPRIPCIVDSLEPKDSAEKAGLKPEDKLISINGISVIYYQDFKKEIQKNKNKKVEILALRNSDTLHFTIPVSPEGRIGFYGKTELDFFEIKTKKYTFFESFPAGIKKGKETMENYIKQFNVLFTVKGASKEVGGFISIGKAYSPTWDWQRFWMFTAFLSIALAIMNILPIPALDGGHVMFLLYEVITGRKPNEKIMEYAQYAGMILLLALLLFANGNDIFKLFGK